VGEDLLETLLHRAIVTDCDGGYEESSISARTVSSEEA
jgi:hypothetical protein